MLSKRDAEREIKRGRPIFGRPRTYSRSRQRAARAEAGPGKMGATADVAYGAGMGGKVPSGA